MYILLAHDILKKITVRVEDSFKLVNFSPGDAYH